MEPLSLCPTCHQPLTIVGAFQICPLHGQVSQEPKPVAPLRIFLSYGHDHNEELVRHIKTDLEKRGHDVWFDKNEIKFGDEWRRSITDGILGSNRVLSFLSKHSTRDPGVCRDEIAIAIGVKGGNIQTILVESEKEVQPPVNIGHIQWLDMHEWQEKKAINNTEWEKWYQAKLAEIVRVVESEETRRFAGEIEKLNEYLKPIKSDARISGLLNKGFYGREWLFEAVENWRNPKSEIGKQKLEISNSRLFWIMGDPGVGKSAFAAQLTHTHGDTVIAAQFVEWDKPDHRDAKRVVYSIAFQMATRLPDYRKLLLTLPEIKELDRKDANELFDYLLANPLKSVINGGREKLLIVIDALDEAVESGRNPLVDMLARNAHHLPAWLGIVVTSRPEFDVKTPFQALNPLPLDTKSESNKADICDYLNNKLAIHLQNQPNPETLLNQILEKSEGVFLYAERFCEDVRQGYISLDQPDQFPQGLGGIFAQYFQRQFPDLEKFRKEIRPALRAILAAREPLPLEILQKLFDWEDEELRDFTRTLGSLFPITKETGCEVIKPYHKSLADWLTDEAKAGVYFVSVMEGHKLISQAGFNDFQTNPDSMLTYFLKHLPAHLLLQGDKARSRSVRESMAFRQARENRFYGKRRSMRIYISSTFSDMQAERDYLVRRTLPELNRILDFHRIDATVVDLRWGIPDEEVLNSNHVRSLVFEEIDRCIPFFVGLIGDRYGWIPFGKTTGLIEEEIEYASKKSDKMLLYSRSIPSQANWPAEVISNFVDSGEFGQRMRIFKARLKQSYMVTTYECHWDAERNQVSGLLDFGSKVLNDLNCSALDVFGPHPLHGAMMSQLVQHDYTQRLLKIFIGRSNVVQQCISMVADDQGKTVFFKGEEGTGKSAVLASVIEHFRTESEFVILNHHAGTSVESLTPQGVLVTWCAKLDDWASRPVDITLSEEELQREFSLRIELAIKESRIVVILDNADWIDAVSGEGSSQRLINLLPNVVTILISSRTTLCLEHLNLTTIHLSLLTHFEAAKLVDVFLSEFSKRISRHHLEIILNKACSGIPAFLVTSLRMLVTSVKGHEELESRLHDMADSFDGICRWFLDSLEIDYGTDLARSLIRRLTVEAMHNTVTLNTLSNGERELLRRIYAVFPEHCTPPEKGMLIRPGSLLSAIIERSAISSLNY